MPRHDPDEPIFTDHEKHGVAPDGRIYVDRAFCTRTLLENFRSEAVFFGLLTVGSLLPLTLGILLTRALLREGYHWLVNLLLLPVYLAPIFATGSILLCFLLSVHLLVQIKKGNLHVMTDTVVRVREGWSLAGIRSLDMMKKQVFLTDRIDLWEQMDRASDYFAFDYRPRNHSPVTTVSFAHAKGFQLYGHDHPISLVNVRDVFLIVSVGRRPLFRRACLWFDTRKYVWKD